VPATFASWGNPVAPPVVVSAGVASVDFIYGLNVYRELMLQIIGATHNSGTPDLELLWAADASTGSPTWQGVGNYNRAGYAQASTASLILCDTTAVTPAAYGAVVELYSWNIAQRTWVSIGGGRDNSNSSKQTQPGFQTNSEALDGLRVQWSTGTDILAGTFTLYGKQ